MAKPKLNLRRYHHKVFFPENVAAMLMEFFHQLPQDISLTYHAADQLLEDKRGIIPLPDRSELLHKTNTLVEFYEQVDASGKPTGVIQKMLIRVHNLNSAVDYCYVLAREGFVVSAWANDKGDDHRLESNAVYWKPKEMVV